MNCYFYVSYVQWALKHGLGQCTTTLPLTEFQYFHEMLDFVNKILDVSSYCIFILYLFVS
jgi:hypothetical protein